MSKPLPFIPTAYSFSSLGRNHEGLLIDPDDGNSRSSDNAFSVIDQNLEDACKEQDIIAILKTLPKDYYRVIALLLFLRELGFDFRYEDIGSIWGNKKVSVFNTIERMQRQLERAGMGAQR